MQKKSPPEDKLIGKVRDYKQVFSTQAGERVLHDILSGSGFLAVPFPKTEFESGFQAGQRSMTTMILQRLSVDPAKLVELARTMEERRQNER